MKAYAPLTDIYGTILRCHSCQRVFTTLEQLRLTYSAEGSIICRNQSACANRAKRLQGIHVKLWRDLCTYLCALPLQSATALMLPDTFWPLISSDGYDERIILEWQYIIPVKQSFDGYWTLEPNWEQRLAKIEQGKIVRRKGDLKGSAE